MMQATWMMQVCFIFGLVLPNLAHAETVHPAVIMVSASIIFMIILSVYVVYRIRKSLRNHMDKPLD
ncbi:hypothetical protein I6L24_05465 [Acinetobacter lwoffii]|uniref:hypothetical protein n=1 Tax=Acinetobacter lwoffii TaxID=28090 RepID=UPI001C2138B8|nr:hypothetical protein [Acinetobacter lwoffii]QXB87037.1 hypothetical protein I6L24_05465 [Acinetobacter lwoffii]